jgi:uncharacterized protein YbjT (DUF2867 family)
MNLVVGATGQLGSAIVRNLVDEGRPVRAFVRATSDFRHLEEMGVALSFGDLRDPRSLDASLPGVKTVLATASAISPGKGGGDVKAVDDRGYRNLIDACARAGVRQFVYASVPVTPLDDRVSVLRCKRVNESRLKEIGIPYTIFRLGMFADVWGALLGSRIPERGAEASTLQRPFWFLRGFRNATGDMIERKGKAMIPGSGDIRVSFITIADAAAIMATSAGRMDALNRVYEVGGGEVLTFDDAVDHYARLLGRPIVSSCTPAATFRAMHLLLKPFSASAAAVMGLNWVTASGKMPVPDPDASRRIAEEFGVTLTPFGEFLKRRITGSDEPPPAA